MREYGNEKTRRTKRLNGCKSEGGGSKDLREDLEEKRGGEKDSGRNGGI